jgi:hypothetical protein
MQQSRPKSGIIVILLVTIVLLWNKSNVWASPDQSPHHQTVPTRVRTNTPTATRKALTPTNTPTTKPNQVIPTNTDTPNNPAELLQTATPNQIPTQTQTLTKTLTATVAELMLTYTQVTSTRLTDTTKPEMSSTITVLPTANPEPRSSVRIGNNALVMVLVGIVVVMLGILAFVLWKRHSR